jgi:hypothetical protein
MILKEVKQIETFKDEYRTENELKPVILKIMLDCEITVQQAEHGDKGVVKFYCAPKANWEKALN